jgi:hypothetical protein
MTRARALTEKLALTILARDGIAAIWQLHMEAAAAYQTGHPAAANAILEIAEAAEEAWIRAERTRVEARGMGPQSSVSAARQMLARGGDPRF